MRRQLHRALWVSAALLLVASVGLAQDTVPRLMSTAWLADHLQDSKLKLVDCRGDIREYWKGHLPGAVWVGPDALSWPDCGIPGKLLKRDALISLLAAIGLHEGQTIVVIADTTDYQATYLAWALEYVKHKQFAVLDGGVKKWVAEQRPLSQDYPKITACPCYWLPLTPDDTVRVTLAQVQEGLKDANTVLLDVRPKELYTGEAGFWRRNGHIPGAVWRSWQDDVGADGALKRADELKAAYAALGVTPDKRIITSCALGQMASHTYFVLRHVLGFKNVANYDGGFDEWQSNADLPVATGDKPR